MSHLCESQNSEHIWSSGTVKITKDGQECWQASAAQKRITNANKTPPPTFSTLIWMDLRILMGKLPETNLFSSPKQRIAHSGQNPGKDPCDIMSGIRDSDSVDKRANGNLETPEVKIPSLMIITIFILKKWGKKSTVK